MLWRAAVTSCQPMNCKNVRPYRERQYVTLRPIQLRGRGRRPKIVVHIAYWAGFATLVPELSSFMLSKVVVRKDSTHTLYLLLRTEIYNGFSSLPTKTLIVNSRMTPQRTNSMPCPPNNRTSPSLMAKQTGRTGIEHWYRRPKQASRGGSWIPTTLGRNSSESLRLLISLNSISTLTLHLYRLKTAKRSKSRFRLRNLSDMHQILPS